MGAPGTRVPCFAGARLYRAFGVCGYSRALRWGCDRIMDTWSVCVAARTMDAIPLMWDERRLVFAACLCDYRPCEPEAHHASAVPRGRAARARREWRDYKTKLGLLFSGRVDKVVCLVLVPHTSHPASGPQRAAWPQEPQVALALWQRRACRADSRTGPTPRPSSALHTAVARLSFPYVATLKAHTNQQSQQRQRLIGSCVN